MQSTSGPTQSILRTTLLTLLVGAAACAESQLVPIPLAPLPGDGWSRATDINPRGEVVGISVETGSNQFSATAVIWDRSGNATPLPPLTSNFFSHAAAISPNGEIVGTSRGRLRRTAVRWDSDGHPIPKFEGIGSRL